jgi:hypothetical protein
MADQVPADWRGKIVHAALTVGGSVLYGAGANWFKLVGE